uniref:Uncharacterized protein n=1 Tax=Eutreptiella gymnastica TaxID=73025 RepID=A0A7S4GM42_9EUGL
MVENHHRTPFGTPSPFARGGTHPNPRLRPPAMARTRPLQSHRRAREKAHQLPRDSHVVSEDCVSLRIPNLRHTHHSPRANEGHRRWTRLTQMLRTGIRALFVSDLDA